MKAASCFASLTWLELLHGLKPMNIQDAIDSPRIHHQWLPDELLYEPNGMSPDTRKILDSYGHKFASRPGNIASATGIMVTDNGLRMGAIDSRSDGEAIGY